MEVVKYRNICFQQTELQAIINSIKNEYKWGIFSVTSKSKLILTSDLISTCRLSLTEIMKIFQGVKKYLIYSLTHYD